MLPIQDKVTLAAAEVFARLELSSVQVETLRAGLRLCSVALDLATAPSPGHPDAAPGSPPAPELDRIDVHARDAIARGYAAARAFAQGGGPARLADAVHHLSRFGFWCRYSGFLALGAAVQEAALWVWPPDERPEDRIWLVHRRNATEGGTSGALPEPRVAQYLKNLARDAKLPRLLPLAIYLEGFHAMKCGRWADAERLAATVIRRARRDGDPRIEGQGLVLALMIAGRREQFERAAALALTLFNLEGALSSIRTSGLSMLGVALVELKLFAPALECWEAALERERHEPRPAGMMESGILSQIMALHALEGNRAGFEELYDRLAGAAFLPGGGIDYHRDAAFGLMRFGDVRRAREELQKAQEIAERYAYHFDWFKLEREMQALRNVRETARTAEELGPETTRFVHEARSSWRRLERGAGRAALVG